MKHPIDLIATGILKFGPDDVRFFTDGWGEESFLHPPDLAHMPLDSLPIEWLTTEDRGEVIITHGAFSSPVPALPHRAGQGSVLLVEPRKQTDRIVVLMPAWNEHEPRVRVALAERLAAHNISSVILENAYFGSRHPDPTEGHPIRTVADFMMMGESAVVEGRGDPHLAPEPGARRWCCGVLDGRKHCGDRRCITAIRACHGSHGSFALALSRLPRRGAVARRVVGMRSVVWINRIGLREVLGRVSVLGIPALPHTSNAVIVGRARSDAYIPRSAV